MFRTRSSHLCPIFLSCLLCFSLLSCVSGSEGEISEASQLPEDGDSVALDDANVPLEEDEQSFTPQAESEPPPSTIPMAIVFLETDIAGNPIESTGVRDGISQELAASGFTLVDTDVQAERFLPDDARSLYTLIREEYAVRRLIFGIARITEVDESDGFLVKVRGSLRVYDLLENEILLLLSADANAQGSDSARTVRSAFSNLEQDLGSSLAEALP